MQKDKIIIVIPCFNEGNTIYKIYKSASRYGKVLVVNDCSTDNTIQILNKKKIKFLSNDENIGYEASIIKGIKYVLNNFKNTKYIATMDADGELIPKFIPALKKNLIKEKLDVIVGSRNKVNRFSEAILKFVFNFKFKINDPISGLKIYKSNVLKKIINEISNNLFLVDIMVVSHNYNFKVGSLNIKVNKRRERARVGGDFFTNIKILKIVLYSILN